MALKRVLKLLRSHLSHFYECSRANLKPNPKPIPKPNPEPSQNCSHLMSLGRAAIKHITRTKLCCCSNLLPSFTPPCLPFDCLLLKNINNLHNKCNRATCEVCALLGLSDKRGDLRQLAVATGKVQQQLLPAVNKHGFLQVPVPRPRTHTHVGCYLPLAVAHHNGEMIIRYII